jgi:hypothetical protein
MAAWTPAGESNEMKAQSFLSPSWAYDSESAIEQYAKTRQTHVYHVTETVEHEHQLGDVGVDGQPTDEN